MSQYPRQLAFVLRNRVGQVGRYFIGHEPPSFIQPQQIAAPGQFIQQTGEIGMLTTLGFAWLYSAARACIRCGPHVKPLAGISTWYVAASGASTWLFAWPTSEQVKLGGGHGQER